MIFRVISSFILRNRRAMLLVFILLTAFFGFMATQVKLSYDFAKILPATDPDYQAYMDFKKTFGEDGTVMVLGIEDKDFFTPDKFNDWRQLGKEIKAMDGIEAVVSLGEIYNISINEEQRKFEVKPLFNEAVTTQAQMDSLVKEIERLPFYDGYIFNKERHATLMAITFDKAKLNTKDRIGMVNEIKNKADAFGIKYNLPMHISGMPFIRTAITAKVAGEMQLFLILAFVVCALILLVFFRSFKVVFFSMVVVLIGVVWSLGTIVLLGYKITMLTGLIPPLIIVIGIPNSILFLNKYHEEFRKHGNKIKALARMIEKIGLTTFLANITTAIGFGVFYFTRSNLLMEFGMVASINVMSTYMISLVLIPIVFSFLPVPDVRHTKHLKAPRINKLLSRIDHWVHFHYRKVFVIVTLVVLVSLYGVTKITSVGYVVDDLPKKDPIYKDMRFFESSFSGVLPLEFSIETKNPGRALDPLTLQKINRLERMLTAYPEFSKPIAVVDGIKFSYQSYRGGDPKYYVLPGSLELADMAGYLVGDSRSKSQMFRSFIDSTKTITRVSVQMADVGSVRMAKLVEELKPRIDSIFSPDDYKATMTGNSLIFLKGNDYLLTNLMESIVLAIVLICIIMFALFMSFRMITVSILPSLIPLIITAGVMGFFHIPLKPSTILIFSIAFGIASDGTIYFLTKYRQEMQHKAMSIGRAVTLTIRETGVGMVYTAVILFFGFFIFSASDFGGTASLGILISMTLVVAMCSNLVLLPALLIALERRLTTRAFLQEPLIQIISEDEDIELEDLEIKKIDIEPVRETEV